jgi:hypothetical protein
MRKGSHRGGAGYGVGLLTLTSRVIKVTQLRCWPARKAIPRWRWLVSGADVTSRVMVTQLDMGCFGGYHTEAALA